MYNNYSIVFSLPFKETAFENVTICRDKLIFVLHIALIVA